MPQPPRTLAPNPVTCGVCLLALLIAFSLPSAVAQSSTAASSSQQSQSQAQPSQSQPLPGQSTSQPKEPQRPLGVLPQFGVTYEKNAAPLRTSQKFRVFWRTAIDPATLVIAGAQAGVGQAENSFAGYGQGAQGYGKRYGAALADEASSGFFSNFLYSTIFKEDPRYFRVGEGSIKHRIGHSLIQEFYCHTDKGGRSFSYENVLGAFTSGSLSNLYYPSTDRGFELTMTRSGTALALGSVGGLLNEFWPDIRKRLFHKRNHPADAAAPPQQ